MSTDRKKIAILLPRFSGGGAERVSVNFARSLRSFGFDTEIWATRFNPTDRAELEREGIVTASPRDIAGKVRHRSRRTMETVASMVVERRIEILVLAVSPLACMTELKRRISPCRLVFHLHGQPFWELIPFGMAKDKPQSANEYICRVFSFLKKDLKEKLFKTYSRRAARAYNDTYAAADAYLVLCESYKTELETRLAIDPRHSKIHVAYNPVAGLEELLHDSDTPKKKEVLFVGRLTHEDKRVDRLLRVWAKIGRDDWQLRILGDGRDRNNLENLARRICSQNVRFEGYSKTKDFLPAAYIVALTSTFEGWPGSLLEALAAGCRPIAFSCSAGVEEILGNGRGILVTPFDEKEYAAKLSALMDCFPGHAPDNAVWLSKFTDEATAQRLSGIFNEIL